MKILKNKNFWGSLVAGIILLIIDHFVFPFIQTTIDTLLKCLKTIFSDSILIPIWILLSLILISLFSIIKLFKTIIKVLNTPEWSEYTTDILFGLKWVWRWSNDNIVSLKPLCPNCLFEFDMERSQKDNWEGLSLVCGRCSKTIEYERDSFLLSKGWSGNLIIDPNLFFDNVEKEIMRKINTKEYKKSLTK
ncbi:MAG: hypothetical protein GY863_14090 [bacterium]|nr:hypothetical protein [bacterium]